MEEAEKYFVFSEEEYAKNTKVMKSIGKIFYCGKVPVGDKVERFTNIIDKDHLTGMRQMFPDIKIVFTAVPSTVKYEPTYSK